MTELEFSDKEMKNIRRIAAQRGTSVQQVVTDCVSSGVQSLLGHYRLEKASVSQISFRKS
tara:strand:- start:637 stop:816 length:180 start_codon:yes stop_codon:yes gene_type:complete